jgi:arginine utilization regulatory protein
MMISHNVKQLLNNFFNHAHEGVVVTAINGVIIYMNTPAIEYLSCNEDEQFEINRLLQFNQTKQQKKQTDLIAIGGKELQIKVKQTQFLDQEIMIYYLNEKTGMAALINKIYLYDEILDSIDDGVIASDHNNRIIVYNKALAEIENHEKEKVLGEYISTVYSDLTPDYGMHATVAKTRKKIPDMIIEYLNENGKIIQLMGNATPVIKDNQLIAIFSIARNLNKTKQLLNKITSLHEQLIISPIDAKIKNNGTTFSLKDIIGTSETIKITVKEAQKAALSSFPVLIYGETGTGKELIAQGIHNAKPLNDKPFVAINCAAIPETLLESTLFGTVKGSFTGAQDLKGLFEQAGEGTLYLDEINSMPINLQTKLLRVLQELKIRRLGATNTTEVKCRIISSTNIDPWECMKHGSLREDLLYRLMVIYINLPPLRDRK